MLWPWPWKNGWAPGLLIGKLVLEASVQIQKQILLNPSSPFSSLGVSTPLTGSDFSSVVAVSWAWSDEAMPELSDFPKRSGDTAKVRKLRLMKPVQDATWGTPWWRVDELAAHLCKIQTFVPYNISQYHLIEHSFSSQVEAARTSSSKVLQVELQPHFLWQQVHKEKASLGTNCHCLKKSQRISTCCHWEKLCTLRREDRKRESIVFCRWDVFECVWTENGGARKHRICGVFWNALSRAVACFMLLMAFWCPPSNNLHKLPQCFITSFSESHQHLRADTRKFTKSTWDKTLKTWPRPSDQYQFSNMGMGGERQGWRLEPDQPETEPLNPEPWPRSTWDKTLKPWTLTLTTWSVPGFEDGHGRRKTGMEVTQINLRPNP